MRRGRIRQICFRFLRESGPSRLEGTTRELIALAASLACRSPACLESHLKEALERGATPRQISEAISITMGVAAASVVDQTDRAAAHLQLKFFD